MYNCPFPATSHVFLWIHVQLSHHQPCILNKLRYVDRDLMIVTKVQQVNSEVMVLPEFHKELTVCAGQFH
jgi:hypothetical protein